MTDRNVTAPDRPQHGRLGRAMGRFGPTVASLVIGLALWEVIVRAMDIPIYILPPPSRIARAMVHGFTVGVAERGWLTRQAYYVHILATLRTASTGFVLGSILGVVLGVLVAEVRWIERTVLPYVTAFQSLPKIALAPLFIIWFGFGQMSRTTLTVALVFFPVMVNTISGFKNVNTDRVDLASSYSATRLQMVRYVKMPSALPFIFAGLTVGVVYSLIGAIVSEFMVGNVGLGSRMLEYQRAGSIPSVFAILVLLGVIGGSAHRLVGWGQKRLVFWAQHG